MTRIAAAAFPSPAAMPPAWRWAFVATGLFLGGLVLLLRRQASRSGARRLLAVVAGGFWLVTGIGGLVLAGLWLFTEHRSAWANENLLQFDPICLLLVPAALALGSGRAPLMSRFAQRLGWVVAALAAAGLFLKVLPGFRQDNLDWILLLLPVHLALAYVLTHRSAPPP